VSGVEGAPHLPLIEEPEEESILIIFETPILDYTKNRINNIRLACKAVSGTILTPGEEFSFNTVVGPRTVEKGYKEAIIFRKNEKVKEVGGGICQLTSTLYGAAKAAGFIITERTTHQLLVDYVEEGEDATVYFGKIDFKFINNLDRQVRIDASCGDGKVAVTITSII
jgi:vancomycin resistance protein YoaR